MPSLIHQVVNFLGLKPMKKPGRKAKRGPKKHVKHTVGRPKKIGRPKKHVSKK